MALFKKLIKFGWENKNHTIINKFIEIFINQIKENIKNNDLIKTIINPNELNLSISSDAGFLLLIFKCFIINYYLQVYQFLNDDDLSIEEIYLLYENNKHRFNNKIFDLLEEIRIHKINDEKFINANKYLRISNGKSIHRIIFEEMRYLKLLLPEYKNQINEEINIFLFIKNYHLYVNFDEINIEKSKNITDSINKLLKMKISSFNLDFFIKYLNPNPLYDELLINCLSNNQEKDKQIENLEEKIKKLKNDINDLKMKNEELIKSINLRLVDKILSKKRKFKEYREKTYLKNEKIIEYLAEIIDLIRFNEWD